MTYASDEDIEILRNIHRRYSRPHWMPRSRDFRPKLLANGMNVTSALRPPLRGERFRRRSRNDPDSFLQLKPSAGYDVLVIESQSLHSVSHPCTRMEAAYSGLVE